MMCLWYLEYKIKTKVDHIFVENIFWTFPDHLAKSMQHFLYQQNKNIRGVESDTELLVDGDSLD